jgi:GAF domain-containing protein
MNYTALFHSATKLLNEQEPAFALQSICVLLEREVPHYTWVGFYFMNHPERTLHLGPYIGLPTDHTTIPFGKGICGQVAVSGNTYVADDVHSEANYIACSVDVKSEIVVPIYDAENSLLAQLDIDSDQVAAFTHADHTFLNALCAIIGLHITGQISYKDFIEQPLLS